MPITYLEAKRTLAKYIGTGGKCDNSKDVDLFCKKVFQYLLISGEHGNLRKFCFTAQKGCFTAPYELDVPLKVKVEDRVGTVWNKWFEWYNYGEMEGCVPASNSIIEEPNPVCTAYELPNKFCRIAALATAAEAPDAYVIISGKDPAGREIITWDQGERIFGEKIRFEAGKFHYTQVVFGEITGIKKSITNGYVQLFWYRPELNLKGFLSDYSPFEETPEYRRFKLTSYCEGCIRVSIIGRIRLKDRYGDNEKIPFENLLALELAGQMINKNYNDDPQMAQAKGALLDNVIERENTHKKSQTGSPIDVFYPLSAGSVKNIIGGY